jgi:hypothetical protein
VLLVLPESEDIDLDVLRKIEQLVGEGATVVGPKPVRSNGLTDHPRRDQQVRQLAERLWGPCDGKTVLEHEHGRGRIIWGRPLCDILRERGLGPDFSFTSPLADASLDFIHRRTEEEDIYFVSNRKSRPEQLEATFRVRGRSPELWEPDTGRVTRQHVFQESPEGISLPVQLAPHGSVFVVFRKMETPLPPLVLEGPGDPVGLGAARVDAWDGRRARLTVFRPGRYRMGAEGGRSAELQVPDMPEPLELEGPWEVRFPGGMGAPSSILFDRLISWTEHPDAGIRYHSGIAEYRRELEVPEGWLAEGRQVWLDLGDLWSVAEVHLNGRSLGVLWKPPFVLEITPAAAPGLNTLVVEIANTWSNRLVGDARLPKEKRFTRTNVLSSDGRAWKDVPLIRCGLLGPVRLVPARVVDAEPR